MKVLEGGWNKTKCCLKNKMGAQPHFHMQNIFFLDHMQADAINFDYALIHFVLHRFSQLPQHIFFPF